MKLYSNTTNSQITDKVAMLGEFDMNWTVREPTTRTKLVKGSRYTFLVLVKASSRLAPSCSAVRFTFCTTPPMSGRIRDMALERRRAGEAGRAIREGVIGKSISAPRMEWRAFEGDVDLRVVCRVPRRFLVTIAPELGEDSSDSSLQQTRHGNRRKNKHQH